MSIFVSCWAGVRLPDFSGFPILLNSDSLTSYGTPYDFMFKNHGEQRAWLVTCPGAGTCSVHHSAFESERRFEGQQATTVGCHVGFLGKESDEFDME